MASGDNPTSLSCLCGQVAQEVNVNLAAASTSLLLCHCGRCRVNSGLLFVSYLPLIEAPDLSKGLRSYTQADNVIRWFCSRCGAHVFARKADANDEYFVALGLVDADINHPIKHYGVADTKDGGLRICLSGDQVNDQPCMLATLPHPKELQNESDTRIGTSNDRLKASCQCGGILFYVTPPDASSTEASSPWSDVLVPYHLHSPANPEDVKWWLRAEKTRYLAGTCACRSCRLASGFPIQAWAFVPKSNLCHEDGSPLSFNIGTMQRYESSPTIFREFCGTCGATVFWHCLERPKVIDVSVGLLRSSTGARARDYLDWATDRVSFAEDAIHTSLLHKLEIGLKQMKN